MIRVLTIAPSAQDGTSFYRLSGVMPYLEKEFKNIVIKDLSNRNDLDWSDYTSYDVVVFQRPFIKSHVAVLGIIKSMGIKIIIDYDDDVLNLDNHNPVYKFYDDNRANIEECAKLADVIWVSTESIKQTFLELNSNVAVVPNAHNDYLFPVKNKREYNAETKKIAYRGGKTHELDVYNHIDDWVEIINGNTNFDFFFVGSRFPYLEDQCGDNYSIVEGLHIIDYFNYFYDLNPNIFIYPLNNSLFNRGKSNISWIEATYAGAAVIAPEYMSEFIKPGIINFNESFVELFNKVKNDNKVLSILNDISWNYIQEHLLLSEVNKKRYQSIMDVKNRK